MCLIFVGIVGKYPQSVITGDSRVQFLIRPDCEILNVNVFSALDMRKWDVRVQLLNDDDDKLVILKKKFNETTQGWDFKIDLKHIAKTGQPRKVIVYAEKPEEKNAE